MISEMHANGSFQSWEGENTVDKSRFLEYMYNVEIYIFFKQ